MRKGIESYISNASIAYKLNVEQILKLIEDTKNEVDETFKFVEYDQKLFFQIRGRRSL